MNTRDASSAFRLLVLGNNTEVGKTWVGARLLRALQRRGLHIAASKPIESGTDESENGYPVDAEALANACGIDEWTRVCRWALGPPIAPAEALERAGITLSDQDVASAIDDAVEGADVALIESAGGLWSPLYADRCSIDLLPLCDAALLIVSDELGGMNQAILSADAIMTRFDGPLWVMLNRRNANAESLGNRKWIQRLRPTLVILADIEALADAVHAACLRRA